MQVSKPMVTAHITNLENKGYIYKEISEEDKRSFYIMPTKKAVELVENMTDRMREHLDLVEEFWG